MPIYDLSNIGQSNNQSVLSWSYTSHTWDAARNGTENKQTYGGALVAVTVGGTYPICYETFWSFDTSVIPAGEEIESVRLCSYDLANGDMAAHDFEARIHPTWAGGNPATSDWVRGDALASLSLFAVRPANEGTTKGGHVFNFITADGANNLVNRSGRTCLVIANKALQGTSEPAATESVNMTASYSNARLIVVTKEADGWAQPYFDKKGFWSNNYPRTPRGLAVGDLMLYVWGSGTASAGPDGLTQIESVGTDYLLAYGKVAERADVLMAHRSAVSGTIGVSGFVSGVNPASPWGEHSGHHGSGSADCYAPSISQVGTKALLCFAVNAHTTTDNIRSGYACENGNPSAWTEEYDAGPTAATVSVAFAWGRRSSSGATGIVSATQSSNVATSAMAFLVNSLPTVEWQPGSSIEINAGAASTDDNDVSLAIACSVSVGGAAAGAPDEMSFSEDGETWGAWEDYATSRAYQLAPQTTYPSEARTVYARFRKLFEGDWFVSDTVSDSITLGIAWTESITLNGGAPTTYGTTVAVALAATSSAGTVTHYRLREDAGTWSAWMAYATAMTLELDGPGSHTIGAQFRDSDDNASPGTTATITVLEEAEAAEIITTEPVQVMRAGILAYMGGQLVAELEAIAGEVTADSRRSVWRTATIDFAPSEEFTFFEIYQLLATPGLELVVRRGWRTAQDDEVIISLGRFVIDEVSMAEDEGGMGVSANCSDLATRIQRARFTDPYVIASGTALATALAELLADRWPDVAIGFDTSTIPNEIGAQVVLEAGDSSDPWTDAQNIAQAHGYVLFFDAEGVARLQTAPDPNTVSPTYFYYRDENAVVVEQNRVAPLERTYSGVVVSGEGSSLATPVRAEAWDEGPQSPTNVNGPFGYVPYFYSSSLITTVDQAKDVALAMLTTVTGRIEQLSWRQVPNPAVKPLDAIEVEDADGYYHTYLLDEVTTPLAPAEAMSATARETRTDTVWVADEYLS